MSSDNEDSIEDVIEGDESDADPALQAVTESSPFLNEGLCTTTHNFSKI